MHVVARGLMGIASAAACATRVGVWRSAPLPLRSGRRSRVLASLTGDSASLMDKLNELAERVEELERVAPREFSLTHYNVLADQYSSNMQPWFLYGAEPPVTQDERRALHKHFYARDAAGNLINAGWPNWAHSVLSVERQAMIEAVDDAVFKWRSRSERLWSELRAADSDLITLAECDHYDDFWEPQLRDAGYQSVYRQRPRQSSQDGSLVGWRASKFEFVAQGGVAIGDSHAAQRAGRLDRTLLLTLLRFKRNPEQRVLVATTHLARNPEKREQTLPRGYQYGLLFRELLEFAEAHDAQDEPVIITGDLNTQSVDELNALTKAVALVVGGTERVHPILSSVQDAPTPPTTRTNTRCLRIDSLLFQATKLRLLKVGAIPPLSEPLPNERQPSDHVPVSARFAFRSPHSQLEADARQWLSAMNGESSVRPLTTPELRRAFAFFDKDGSEVITPIELEAGMQLLSHPSLSPKRVRAAVREVTAPERSEGGVEEAAEPAEGFDSRGLSVEVDSADHIVFEQFATAYLRRAHHMETASVIQLRIAFSAFDTDADGVLTVEEFADAMKRVAPHDIDDASMASLVGRLDANGDGLIVIEEWLSFCLAQAQELSGVGRAGADA